MRCRVTSSALQAPDTESSGMEKLENYLDRCRNGAAVLFCGAGFTADCLNFDDDAAVGVTSHLLQILNNELQAKGKRSGFHNIKNAAKRFKDELGSHRLMEILQDRFRLSKVSASVEDITRYPWASIYTTNYDNGIEIALQRAGKKFTSLNNLDDPDAKVAGIRVIHLHGFAERWTNVTFEDSCVLDARSYYRLSNMKGWLDRLRYDIERASVVVFIGFSADDFHLSEVFFNASGLREKAFFINRPSPSPNVDEYANQEEFGRPLYIGREQFAELAIKAARQQAPIEPQLASFIRYEAPQPSSSVPPVEDIEDLFIWGKAIAAHLKRDQNLSKSDYHVLRSEAELIRRSLTEPGTMVLVYGDICSGKTLAVTDAINGFFGSRPIFELRHAYADLVDEASSILSVYPNAVFVVENCFSLHEDRLLGIARQVLASAGGLILSARSISTEGESSKLRALRKLQTFSEVRMGLLKPPETDALIVLLDQIAGWRKFRAMSQADRQRFVKTECEGHVPNVLLRLLESSYVRDKYREEYNKISYTNSNEKSSIIGALLLSNIGLDASISFLSDVFELDFVSVMNRISAQSGALKLVQINGDIAHTVPSIGARNLLRNVVETRDVVNTTMYIVEKLAEFTKRSDLESHIFTQLMRYSILSSIVSDVEEINRFFDHISKIDHFRRLPLFWLQWHMAMAFQRRWKKAEEYLEMGYTAADNYDKRHGRKFNRKQLNDRKAKFLVERADSEMRSNSDLFRDIKEALDIVGRLLRDSEVSHHPYETLLMIVEVMQSRATLLLEVQHAALADLLRSVSDSAKRRVDVVTEGGQRSRASTTLSRINTAMIDLPSGSR
jgi:hypothetical protein